MKGKLKRYPLLLPLIMFDHVVEAAKRRYSTIVEFIIWCIKLGLFLYQEAEKPDTTIYFCEKGKPDKQILFF